MLGVQIRLVAMRTRVLAVSILSRNHALRNLATALSGRIWPSWSTRQDTTSALRSHHVCRRLLILHKRWLLADLAHLSSAC